jgi:hypothetical protein
MPILISDARTRIALQVGLAIVAAEEAVVAKEAVEQRLGEILERTYKTLDKTKNAEQLAKDLPEFQAWKSSQK